MKKLLLLLLCTTMILSCVACGSEEDKDKKKEEIGAEIPVYLSTPIYNFDPAYAYTDEATTQVLSLLYMGLTTLSEDGKVKPGLAKEWKIIKNSKKNEYAIEFTLQKNARWSDGTAITSTDFVYSWTRLLDPEFTSEAAALLYDIHNARAYKNCDISSQFDIGIIPLETNILRVEFDREIDFDRFLVNCASLSLAPVYEDYVIIHKDWATNPTLLVTCGPFMVRAFKSGVRLVLDRNQYYLRGERDASDKYVRPKTLIIDLSLTAEEQLQKFEDGSIFFMGYIPVDSRAKYRDDKRLVLKDTMTTHTYYFNTTKAPFDNADVRNALSLAIDRAAIAQKLVFATAAEGYIPAAAWNTTRKNSFRENGTALVASSADMTKAQSLIASAGLNASDMNIQLSIRPNEVDRVVAEMVKNAWEQLGFKVQIKELEVKKYPNSATGGNSTEYELLKDELRDALYAGNFDVIAVDATMLTPDPMSMLSTYAMDFCGTATADVTARYDVAHLSGYHNLEYDALIEQAYQTNDAKERAAILHRAEELLIKEMPAMPLFVYQNSFLVSSELSKIKYDCMGNYIFIDLKLKNFKKYLKTEK